jgi:hypothetical protein
MMDDDALLAAAKAFRAESEERRLRLIGEFETTRPTPNQDECDRAALGEVVMIKEWDLAPIDPQSFDPFEPPGRPAGGPTPPVNSVLPVITPISPPPTVGGMLAVTNGTWSGSPTFARQWRRDGTTNIGAGATSYTMVALDEGAMISCIVTATNAAGSDTAESVGVGPVAPAASEEPPNGEGDGEVVAPTRTRRR